MNEAKLLNNLPLNGDLKPLSIGDENSPLELSTTKVRIQNLDVIGDFNIDGQDDNLLDRTGTNTYVKNTGDNFGIGTTSPTNELHIDGDVRIEDGHKLFFGDTATGEYIYRNTNDLKLYSGDDILINAGDDIVHRGDKHGFEDTSASRVMTIDAGNGKVGIGTSSPSTLLHLQYAGNTELRVEATGSNDAELRMKVGGASNNSRLTFEDNSGAREGGITYKHSDDYLSFSGKGTDGEMARFDSSGNFGIGTTSPSQPLHIVSSGNGGLEIDNSSGAPTIIFDIPSNEQARLYFQEDDTVLGSIIYETSGTPDAIAFKAGSNTERMRITDTGNVGIGITAPDEKLHIVGSVWIDDNGTNDGLIINPGSGSGKTSIQALENGSSTQPLELQATSFDFWGQSVRLLYLDTNSNISLSNNDDGTSNTVFGYQAGHLIGSGDNYNTFIGHQVADADMTNATNNVGIGYQALSALTEGDRNIVIGYQAGLAITNNLDNVVIGNQAFKSADGGQSQNVVIGKNAGDLINTATQTDNNVIIGMEAGRGGSGAVKQCVVIGRDAMKSTGSNAQTGTIAIGMEALTVLSSGARNTAIGYQSQIATTTGENNTAVGYESLHTNIDGDKNTAIGYRALYSMEADTDGHGWNTAVGNQAGNDVSSGVLNSIFGHDAGNTGSNDLTTGDANTLLGAQSAVSASGASNQTAVGYGATGQADNSVTLGNANVTKVYMAQDSGATVYCGDINVQYHYVRAGINYDQTAGTFVVIPLDGTTRPFTAFTSGGEKLTMIAPHNGTLETIYIRSEEVAGNPVVVGFHKATDGTEVPSTVPTASVSVDMSAVADDTSTKFAFTSNNTFSAGDVLGFSIDPANDINDCSFMIVLKFDTTT